MKERQEGKGGREKKRKGEGRIPGHPKEERFSEYLACLGQKKPPTKVSEKVLLFVGKSGCYCRQPTAGSRLAAAGRCCCWLLLLLLAVAAAAGCCCCCWLLLLTSVAGCYCLLLAAAAAGCC